MSGCTPEYIRPLGPMPTGRLNDAVGGRRAPASLLWLRRGTRLVETDGRAVKVHHSPAAVSTLPHTSLLEGGRFGPTTRTEVLDKADVADETHLADDPDAR